MQLLTSLISTLREKCLSLLDRRTGKNGTHTMQDAGMSAFSCFFMQCASFLEHQKRLENEQESSNCKTLFQISEIPTHVQMGNLLDGVDPNHFDNVFKKNLRTLEEGKALQDFKQLDDRILIALDGTEYHNSYHVMCDNCSHRKRSNGEMQYFHTFLGATIVTPGKNQVIPLPPEFITPQDGHDKQDCESMAARRWLQKHGAAFSSLKPIYLGDDLFSKHPICEAIINAGGSFILTCKPDSHKVVMEYVNGATLEEHRTTIINPGKNKNRHYSYRWLQNIPIRDGETAIQVNWFEITVTDDHGKVTFRNSYVTDIEVSANNVVKLAECGRARWKIENGNFNVLKNLGYNLEHNFSHGKETLSTVYVVLNLLAFAFHTTCDLMESLWQEARAAKRLRTKFFHHLECLTSMFVFPSWEACMKFMIKADTSLLVHPSG
jgi:hypothetical protein